MSGCNIRPDQVVAIKIGFSETELRETVKQASTSWDKDKKAWQLSLKSTYELGLEKRIIDELGF